MNPAPFGEQFPRKWGGRIVVVLILAPTVVVAVGVVVWFVFFPPFSGT